MNYLEKALDSGDSAIARNLKARIAFFSGNEALGAQMSQVNRERVETGNGIDGFNLERLILAERETTAKWVDDMCPDVDEEYAPIDQQARWEGWMAIIKDYMLDGIAPPSFNRALKFRRTKAYSEDYDDDIEQMREVAEAANMPFSEAEAREMAIKNRLGLRLWIDRNGDEAVTRCLVALNPATVITADEPEDFDDIVVKAHKAAKAFAWKGAMKGIKEALSDLMALTALEK